jgi:lipid-binding SYLF domain-containing protein
MKKIKILSLLAIVSLAIFMVACSQKMTPAEERNAMAEDARKALASLYASTPGAQAIGDQAKGILVFPTITKGGFVVGGQYGNGVLFKNGRVAGYYNSTAGSFGLQAGLQKFGYAMFFMEEENLVYMAKSLTTTTLRKGVYAFFFGQTGLMAGLGVQGSKITRINPGS